MDSMPEDFYNRSAEYHNPLEDALRTVLLREIAEAGGRLILSRIARERLSGIGLTRGDLHRTCNLLAQQGYLRIESAPDGLALVLEQKEELRGDRRIDPLEP